MSAETVTPDNPLRPLAFARSRSDLFAEGWTARSITAAVRTGALIRVRNGVYLPSTTDRFSRDAARLGGRVTCVTELSRVGVFVLTNTGTHVQLAPTTSRTTARETEVQIHRHWNRLAREPHPRSCSVEWFDALLHAIRCQEPKAAIATIDSALLLGVIHEDELDELFRLLPRRYRVLRRLIDGRAESGPESLMRLLLRRLGVQFDVQVEIRGVGRVDFVVDGWLIVECDSQQHHSSWKARREDLRRDLAAAALGFTTFRAIAEDIMWHDDEVLAALRGLLRSRRRSESRTDRVRALV
jgi:very-short-patch-repair endonuclease